MLVVLSDKMIDLVNKIFDAAEGAAENGRPLWLGILKPPQTQKIRHSRAVRRNRFTACSESSGGHSPRLLRQRQRPCWQDRSFYRSVQQALSVLRVDRLSRIHPGEAGKTYLTNQRDRTLADHSPQSFLTFWQSPILAAYSSMENSCA